MSIPASYTEGTLASYCEDVLGALAVVLELTAAGGDFAEAVNSALLEYGVTDISSITGSENIRKLRGLASVEAWRVAVTESAGDYDFSAGGASYHRSQVHKQALEGFKLADTAAQEFANNYEVGTGLLVWKQDPYQYRPDDER